MHGRVTMHIEDKSLILSIGRNLLDCLVVTESQLLPGEAETVVHAQTKNDD